MEEKGFAAKKSLGRMNISIGNIINGGGNGFSGRSPWIGVDLDGTLAHYTHSGNSMEIGEPIEPMVERVRNWISQGWTVKIFTARASMPRQVKVVREWLAQNNLPPLEITNVKDFGMVELWDDRCVQVNVNTGVPVSASPLPFSERQSVPGKTRLRKRNRPKPRSAIGFLFAIGRLASTWNRVPRHEFIPIVGPR